MSRTSFFSLLVIVAAIGCGSRTLELPRGGLAAPTDAGGIPPSIDTGGTPTEPPGTSPLPLKEGSSCSSRRDGCRGGGTAEAEKNLFNAIRVCAPRSVSDVCVFDLTVDFDAEGCPSAAFTASDPAGVAPETTSRFRSCVVEILARARLSCLGGARSKAGCG